MKQIFSLEELQTLLQQYPKIFVLKHSLTCPISQEGFFECESFAKEHPDVPFVYLTVQESRPLSTEIMKTFDIRHESPQCLLFREAKVVWHASHFSITKSALESAWSN